MNKEGVVVEGGVAEHTVGLFLRSPIEPTPVANDGRMFSKAQCIKNLGNVLTAAGSSWEKVVKVNVYLKNMDDFAAMNKVYSEVRSCALTKLEFHT